MNAKAIPMTFCPIANTQARRKNYQRLTAFTQVEDEKMYFRYLQIKACIV
jgi:hypothetical protein